MSLRYVLVAALLPLAACTTFRPLPDTQPATLRQVVEPGSRVEVELADGTRQRLTVDSVSETELVGRDEGRRHAVPLASIRSIAIREMTTRDKIWTGISVAAVIGAIAVVASDSGGGGGGEGGSGY